MHEFSSPPPKRVTPPQHWRCSFAGSAKKDPNAGFMWSNPTILPTLLGSGGKRGWSSQDCSQRALTVHCIGGWLWPWGLFSVLFIPLRKTEEISVQESCPLFPHPGHMKAAEQTEKSKMITPCWKPDVLPRG